MNLALEKTDAMEVNAIVGYLIPCMVCMAKLLLYTEVSKNFQLQANMFGGMAASTLCTSSHTISRDNSTREIDYL